MRRLWFVVSVLALLLIGCSEGERQASQPESEWIGGGLVPNCTRYSWNAARAIPDGDPEGILLGPIFTEEDGSAIGTVILRLNIRHPATGDVAIRLAYDRDGDGVPEVQAPVEFHRSRWDPRSDESWACPQSLRGTYFFRDAPGDDAPPFARFRNLRRGRGFYLAVADTLAGDSGSVVSWAVCFH